MKREQAFASVVGLAVFAIALPSLAQSPAAGTAPPASGAPAPPPGGNVAPPAADAPASPPAPAPPPADAWSQLIRQGQQQERANETDAERERREEREAREREPRLGAAELARRNRLRFFPWVGIGAQLSPHVRDQSYGYYSSSMVSQTTLTRPSFSEGAGWALDFGVGLRGGIAQHFDLQARLALTIQGTSSSCGAEVQEPGMIYSSYRSGDCSVSILGAHLDATVRWLPGLLVPRFFVGLGPLAEASNASGSGTIQATGSHTIQRDQPILSVAGLLEFGAIFGSNEEWEAALRTSLGPTNEGDARGFVMVTGARSF